MWHISRRTNHSIITLLLRTHLNSTLLKPKQCSFSITALNLSLPGCEIPLSCGFEKRVSSFRSFNCGNLVVPTVKLVYGSDDDDDDDISEGSENDDIVIGELKLVDEGLRRDVRIIMDIFGELRTSRPEVKVRLDECDVIASSALVLEVLSRVNSDWEAAFTFFLWAGKQPDYAHSLREYHVMIYILGKARKFDTAWSLIDEMRGGKTGPSLVTPQTLVIMIRRYCAVHDVGKAINTFYAYKRFGFNVGVEEFQNLLSALSRYKNVEDAEHLLFCNKNVFPFNTKSFNIILNGWCNVIASQREAERFWMKMSKLGIERDVVSYANLISCYSKSNDLNKVLRSFGKMREMNISPDRKVYNAVIHALAKARHVKEARDLIKQMKEKDVDPNTVTYNSLIKPLCKARKVDEAKEVLDEMLLLGLSPTIYTYHAFFRMLRTDKEVFMLLEKMKMMDCNPNSDTYIMLIRKFCRWRQLDNVFKLWNEMSENGICPHRSSYIVLIHGLFLNGKLEEAYKYYIEMQDKQLNPEPSIDEMFQAWVSGKQNAKPGVIDSKDNQVECSKSGKKSGVTLKKSNHEGAFHRQPENRQVIRKGGFSFWEQ